MANVNTSDREPTETRRERAQLLIVIGFVLAIALVSLALFLNSIIYAENVGSRGADIGGSEATEFVTAVETSGEGAIRAVNDPTEHDGFDGQVTDLKDTIDVWDDQSRLHYTSKGGYTATDVVDEEPGTQIMQDDTRSFTAADGDSSDWTLVSDTEARDFVLTVSTVDAGDGDPFTVCVSESGGLVDDLENCEVSSDVGTLEIYETENGIAVVAEGPNGSDSREVEDGEVRVDFSEGTVNGEDLDLGTVFDDDFDSYDIAYLNGDTVEGTYRFVVNKDELDDSLLAIGTDRFNDPYESPYTYDAIWSATFSITYENSRIEYQSEITIVPGEIDD